ncbi:MAG: reverse transcriptase domain-containing protein [Candidatus Peribacteraceae bacterium]|nr:reverse transcriptase domain-containing protein [Candidatus Peribacteraceae bacterium]MDD5739256.1 reverse transcriptase domain-containing protein [Candidatus Peribacteraceae bacterium]
MEEFRYRLEENLFALETELTQGTYRHGPYKVFTVSDAKKRSIAVASIKDRLVHRLLYDHLEEIYDPVFLFDAWSCRKEKGLHKAIERAQHFLHRFRDGWFWRGDVRKFFDNVDQSVLLSLLKRRVSDQRTLSLLSEVIGSYGSGIVTKVPIGARRGIPIGNVTSQIFANIYLHEFDRFVKHTLKVRGYLRYGDDFVFFAHSRVDLETASKTATAFLLNNLSLPLHPRNNVLLPCKRGLHFLGYQIFPNGRRLPRRTWNKLLRRLGLKNVASYAGLVRSEGNEKHVRRFEWETLALLDTEIVH